MSIEREPVRPEAASDPVEPLAEPRGIAPDPAQPVSPPAAALLEAGGAAGGVLAALRQGEWISGAAVARAGGVTRAAVWKAIERLRAIGYQIEAEAGRGYRLNGAPDLLLPDEIERHLLQFGPRRWRGAIVHREEIDSTNRLAGELARDGAPEGTVVVAEAQTAGRGRLGRSWSSPRSKNLYLSVVLRPPVAPLAVPRLTLVAGIALARAVAATMAAASAATGAALVPAIKWPNDLLLDGRKAAGILTELDAEAERVRHVVLGIGVNLNATITDFPEELRDKATSLALAGGARVDRAAFAARLLHELGDLYARFCSEGFTALRPEYERWHGWVGETVRIAGAAPGADSVVGVVRGVDDEGALRVDVGGQERRLLAGEITLEGSYRSMSRG